MPLFCRKSNIGNVHNTFFRISRIEWYHPAEPQFECYITRFLLATADES